MILYNTIVGLAAGVGLLLVVKLLKQFINGEKVQPEGFALTFGITGFIQTVTRPDYLSHVAVHQGAAREHYDGRAGARFRSIARRCLVLYVAQARDFRWPRRRN